VEETIFELPADVIYQDDMVTAFRDINPQAPTHVLIIPNKPIPTVNDVTEEDRDALGQLFIAAAKIAEQEGIAKSGYRLLINCGPDGGQEVYHMHMHLVGGRKVGPMLMRM